MKAFYLLIAVVISLSTASAAVNPGKLEVLAENYKNLADKPLIIDFKQGDYNIKYDLKKNIAEIKPSKSSFILLRKTIELYDPTLLLEANNVRFTLSHSF